VAKFFNSSATSSSSQPMASATSLNISLLHSYIPLVGSTASEIWVGLFAGKSHIVDGTPQLSLPAF